MTRLHRLFPILFIVLLLVACGGGDSASEEGESVATAGDIEVLDVTFAHGLTEEMAPIDPGNEFGPEDPVSLSIKLKGVPKEGVIKAAFYDGDTEIASTSVDLAQAWEEQGLIFAVGGNSFVGFTLTPSEPFPPGQYQAKVWVNDVPVGVYTYTVVGDASAPEGDEEQAATTSESTEAAPSETSATTPGMNGGEVAINALYYAYDPNEQKAIGGTSPVRIRVQPAAAADEMRVGFFEEEVAGTGDMWRAAGWMAVIVASQIAGIDPRDYEFSFSVGGRIDGPSAGTYMTVGVLAALNGKTMREDAAMTGTINPDGTVGPVGGIPHKIEGAAEQGIKLVLVPAGQRYDYDQNKGELVDLVEVGEKLGVEVREVSTVFEAYELLVGEPLPRPDASTATPQLPPRAFDRTRAKAQEWLSRYQQARAQFDSLSPEITGYFEDGMLEADDTATRADSALQQGLAAVAYQRAVDAAMTAQLWLLAAEVVERYALGDIFSSIDYLRSTQASLGELDAVISLLETQQPRTGSDYVALFDAYLSIGQAQGLVLIANSTLDSLAENVGVMSDEELVGELAQLSAYYVLAQNLVQLARDSVEIGFGYGGTPVEDPERVAAMEALFRRAAEANLRYFEATVVDEYADAYGVHPNQMRDLFMQIDSSYLLSVAALQGGEALAGQLTNAEQQTALRLGNSVGNYAQSAALVAKYYSLDVELDENGNVASIGRERALADMLDLADQRAREAINMNGDDVPVMAVLAYETARLKRQGSPSEQIEALQNYWAATTLAHVQAYLNGVIGR
nr:S16 family serine protease [Ardenticatena sp.]